MRPSEELYWATLVAEFLTLTPDRVGAWREKNPGFAPSAWWDYVPTNRDNLFLWQIVQKDVLDAWDYEFDIGPEFMKLLWSVFDPNVIYFPPTIKYRPPFPQEIWGGLAVDALRNNGLDWYPFHRGLLYLRDHPKLVKTCKTKTCGAPIVARTYCESCANAVRSQAKRDDYDKHKKKRRADRREKYAREKKRRGAYKRKTVALPL